jgi:hypothetical protein
MVRTASPFVLAVPACLILFTPARAQTLVTNPYQTVVGRVRSPYWGYAYNPYGDLLYGAADLVRAQGELLLQNQRAALLNHEVKRAKLETRRKELEHREWERDFLSGSLERERQRVQATEEERARKHPPLTEILSAKSLNDLLDHLQRQGDLAVSGSVRVEAEWLPHIHFTSAQGGNLGLLKDKTLFWPLLLRRSDFRAECKGMDDTVALLKKQLLAKGYVEADDLIAALGQLAELQKQVRQQVRATSADAPVWSPSTFIEAQRYLGDLKDAFSLLKHKEAAFYLNPLQGRTVAELVQYMKSNGLRFARATDGCERHYLALHQALAEASRAVPK